jgi:hypothetical protein
MGLDTVELVLSWEKEFDILIPNETAARLETPALAADAIAEILHSKGRNVDREMIDAVIRRTTLEATGMKEADYRRDGFFVKDFGLD